MSFDFARFVNRFSGPILPLCNDNPQPLGTAAPGVSSRASRCDHVHANPFTTWITPSFDASNFSANGAMTWTVESGDVVTYAYLVVGKTMWLNFRIATSTVGGTLNNSLLLRIPGGFTNAKSWRNFIDREYVGVSSAISYCECNAGQTQVSLRYDSNATNWTAGTNNVLVAGCLCFEIQ